MDRGLRAPLSPNEEIALRRVAYGSIDVATRYVERLAKLALVERHGRVVRLTPVGIERVRLLGGPVVDDKPLSPLAVWLPLVGSSVFGPARVERDFATWSALLPSK